MEWACGELLVKELILFPQVPNSSQSYFRHWEHLAQHEHIFQVQITDWEWGQYTLLWVAIPWNQQERSINIAWDFPKDETPHVIRNSSFTAWETPVITVDPCLISGMWELSWMEVASSRWGIKNKTPLLCEDVFKENLLYVTYLAIYAKICICIVIYVYWMIDKRLNGHFAYSPVILIVHLSSFLFIFKKRSVLVMINWVGGEHKYIFFTSSRNGQNKFKRCYKSRAVGASFEERKNNDIADWTQFLWCHILCMDETGSLNQK